MSTLETRTASPQFITWFLASAIAGVCSVVLPPYLTRNGLSQHAYGWPLIPWFALAWANVRVGVSMLCFLVLGCVLGMAQPRRWWLLALATVSVSPVLNAINIVHDWAHDSTSHNLFPFEFLIYGFICLPVVPGAFLGLFLAGLWTGRDRYSNFPGQNEPFLSP